MWPSGNQAGPSGLNSPPRCEPMEGFLLSRIVQGLAAWPQYQPQTNLRADAIFLCAYEVYFGVDTNTEAAFLHRCDGRDELVLLLHPDEGVLDDLLTGRMPAGARAGIAAFVERQCDPSAAGRALMDALFEARTSFAWPVSLSIPGVVDADGFRKIVGTVARRLAARSRSARRFMQSEIVRAAEEMRLRPEPSGSSTTSWQANCPGTQHFLMLDAKRDVFGCGWCKRRGGPHELRAFAEQRLRSLAARRGGTEA